MALPKTPKTPPTVNDPINLILVDRRVIETLHVDDDPLIQDYSASCNPDPRRMNRVGVHLPEDQAAVTGASPTQLYGRRDADVSWPRGKVPRHQKPAYDAVCGNAYNTLGERLGALNQAISAGRVRPRSFGVLSPLATYVSDGRAISLAERFEELAAEVPYHRDGKAPTGEVDLSRAMTMDYMGEGGRRFMGVDIDADGLLDVLHISGPGGEADVLVYDLAHLPGGLQGRLPKIEYQRRMPTPDLKRLLGHLCRAGTRLDYVEFPGYTNPDEPVPVDPNHYLRFDLDECVKAIPLRGTLHVMIGPSLGEGRCYENATLSIRFLTRENWNQVGRHNFKYVDDLARYFHLRERLQGQGREVAGHMLNPWVTAIPDTSMDYRLPAPDHGGTWNERGLGFPEIRWTSPEGGFIDLPLKSTDRGERIHRQILRIPFTASEGENIIFGDRVEIFHPSAE